MPRPTATSWAFVQRDQCNGRTLTCVNCGAKFGERHKILCYAQAQARQKARRQDGDGDHGE